MLQIVTETDFDLRGSRTNLKTELWPLESSSNIRSCGIETWIFNIIFCYLIFHLLKTLLNLFKISICVVRIFSCKLTFK